MQTPLDMPDSDFANRVKWSGQVARVKAPAGAEILAPARGHVEKVWYNDKTGHAVRIAHRDGQYLTVFTHLQSRAPVEPGQRVHPGDVIGKVGKGTFGYAMEWRLTAANVGTGPQRYIDPRTFFQTRAGRILVVVISSLMALGVVWSLPDDAKRGY